MTTPLAERIRLTILLLQSLHDYFPHPETSTGKLSRRSTLPGIAPSRKQPCTTCQGQGTLKTNHTCQHCQGRGWHHIDDYTNQPVETEDTGPINHTHRIQCDSCGGGGRHGNGHLCQHCTGRGTITANPPLRLIPDTGPTDSIDYMLNALTRTLRLRTEHQTYRDLHNALNTLEEHDTGAHTLVLQAFVTNDRPHRTLRTDEMTRCWLGLVYLADQMPERIVVPSEVLAAEERRLALTKAQRGPGASRRALAERNDQVRRWHAEGRQVTWIAAELSVSRQTVHAVLRGEAA